MIMFERHTHLGPKCVGLPEIHGTAEGVLKQEAGVFHSDQRKRPAWLNLDRDIDVTVRTRFTARDGAENGKMTYAAPTEFHFLRPDALHDVIECACHNFSKAPCIPIFRISEEDWGGKAVCRLPVWRTRDGKFF